MEIQIDEKYILQEWDEIDKELLKLGIMSFFAGTLLLFFIFKFLSVRLKDRQTKLEEKNALLQKTNQKLAQSYKTAGLGALSGHLMHSLKIPLTHLQMIVREAENKKEVDVNELREVQMQIRELVTQSLQSLQVVENKSGSYTVGKRTKEISGGGRITIPRSSGLSQSVDNLQSTLLLSIIISLVENAFETFRSTEVLLEAQEESQKVIIYVEDKSGGIPESEKPFLFDPSKSNKKGGTGLGLALSRQLALSMDADLSLIKSDNIGSIFCISFAKLSE